MIIKHRQREDPALYWVHPASELNIILVHELLAIFSDSVGFTIPNYDKVFLKETKKGNNNNNNNTLFTLFVFYKYLHLNKNSLEIKSKGTGKLK